jgi:ubiquinone/menaquinone biosynthesis C-methylase UbiE
MSERIVALYDVHPVDAEQILDDLRARGRAADALTPEDLFPLDQDHYGGAEATEALGARAGIVADDHVLDLCSGLGGPARYVAWRFGCRVTGIDVTASRVADARRLTELVGLDDRVELVHGDVTELPFPGGRFDVCLSQESLLHVRDKVRLFAECRRVLRDAGRLAFSDWVARPGLGSDEHARLERGFSAAGIVSAAVYYERLEGAGFTAIEVDDLSEQWKPVLRDRLERIRGLRERTVARFGAAHFENWQREYAYMVGLVETDKLGGARFVAQSASRR